jgi:hypothetical protein
VQCSAVQFSAVQCSAVQCSAVHGEKYCDRLPGAYKGSFIQHNEMHRSVVQ